MTQALQLDDLPYQRDSCQLFERIRDLPGAALLDSSFPHSTAGRYDILAAAPIDRLATLPDGATESQTRDFFQNLSDYHHEHYAGIQPVSQDIPFCGGILGYIGYDCGNNLESVHRGSTPPSTLPQVQLQAYNWCVVQDHLLRRATLVCQPGVSSATHKTCWGDCASPPHGILANSGLMRSSIRI